MPQGIPCPLATFPPLVVAETSFLRAGSQDHPELKKGEELYWLHHAGWLTSITFGQYVAGQPTT